MNAMRKRSSNRVERLRIVLIARTRMVPITTTIHDWSRSMSKLSVAELIGESPEMLKLCGRLIQLEFDFKENGDTSKAARKAFRANKRSIEHHMRVVQRIQAERNSIRGPLMANWSDEEIDVHIAVYGNRASVRFTGFEWDRA